MEDDDTRFKHLRSKLQEAFSQPEADYVELTANELFKRNQNPEEGPQLPQAT